MTRFNKLAITAVCAALGISTLPMRAEAQTTYLYNGVGSETPDSAAQGGWLEYTAAAGSPTVSSSAGATTLNTTVGNLPDPPAPQLYSDEAGYSNYTSMGSLVKSPFPSLNPATGFSVSFDVAINGETHGADDTRAGFDVIVLGSDHIGVELGFWTDDIWAQQYTSATGLITPDSSEDYDDLNAGGPDISTSSMTQYTLSILNGSYSLTSGTTNPVTLFSGSTHDYSAYTGVEPNPYSLSNYIFIGDDTMDAEGNETFSLLSVTVPEPATEMGLLVLGSVALAADGDNHGEQDYFQAP